MSNPKQIFDVLRKKINDDPLFRAKLGMINASYEFQISGGSGGTWTLFAIPEEVYLVEGTSEMPPSCEIEISDDNFVKLVEGKLSPTWAWISRKIKTNNKKLAMRLGEVFK